MAASVGCTTGAHPPDQPLPLPPRRVRRDGIPAGQPAAQPAAGADRATAAAVAPRVAGAGTDRPDRAARARSLGPVAVARGRGAPCRTAR